MVRPAIAVFDANVLYSASLRDLLVRLALAGLVGFRCTNRIHEEWIRNVIQNYPDITREKAENVRDLMNLAIPDGIVTDYEDRIKPLALPDPDDRHVLAAAIHADAEVIVTFNLKDFPAVALAGYSIEAMHPDEFLASLFDAAPGPFRRCPWAILRRGQAATGGAAEPATDGRGITRHA